MGLHLCEMMVGKLVHEHKLIDPKMSFCNRKVLTSMKRSYGLWHSKDKDRYELDFKWKELEILFEAY